LAAIADALEPAAPIVGDSLRRQVVRRFLRHRLAILGLVLLAVIAIGALAGPLVVGQDPNKVDLRLIDAPPSAGHVLGGDRSGRDVFARVLHGARTSMIVGFGAVAVYVLVGTVLGAISGYLGGPLDHVLMRVTDTVLSIPILLLVIVFVSVVGPSLVSVIAVIGLLGWPGTARIVRGQFLALREAEFVTAARVVGAGDADVIVRHLLPNIVGPLSVLATFGVANSILLEASLSFLGLGVQAPTASLGIMINEARAPSVLHDLPWLWLPPGLLIALIVLSVNFVGDGLRDALDPRAARRG
jgi:peptide/nickel transport system permease protein